MDRSAQYFSDVVRDFVTSPQFSKLIYETSLALFCKTIATTADVARVGIWSIDQANTRMSLQAQHAGDAAEDQYDGVLGLADIQGFLQAIAAGQVVDCENAMQAQVCNTLSQRYLPTHGITSLLGIPLNCCGRVCGVLLLEHVGEPRKWTPAEQDFATTFSGFASQAFAMKDHAPPTPDVMALQRRTKFYSEYVADWYWETDANYKLLSVTNGISATSHQMHSLIGHTIWDIPRFAPMNCTWTAFQSRLQHKQPIDGVLFSQPPGDGPQRYGEVTARPVYDDAGVFVGYWGISRDVTSRVAQENELKVSERKYLHAARIAHVASWVWDEIEGRVTYCSPELFTIYGADEAELIRRTKARKLANPKGHVTHEKNLSWIHPDDVEDYRRVTQAASHNQTGYDTVMRIVRDDGTVRTLHERCEPVFDAAGRFIETTGVLMDITAQEERKRELANSRAQITNLMDNIPGAIYRIKNDQRWTRIYTSAGYAALCCPMAAQADDDQGRDLKLWDLVAEPYMKIINDAAAQAVQNGSVYAVEYPVTRKDGTTIWLSDRGRPVMSENGEIELEGILIDITQKRETEETLLKAQRLEAVGQLTGGIAHDFNNLLAVILGNLELLRGELSDPEHIEFADAGIGATWRGAELTKNMLSFARRARLQPTMLDLSEIVVDTHKWVSRTLPENIALQIKSVDGLWQVEADRSATESALLNLIVNARDAMPSGGILRITTENVQVDDAHAQFKNGQLEVGRYVVLTVADTGHGMTAEVFDRIFEPFFTTKSAGSGSGLGLSMIQGFIKQSGGTVQVSSQLGLGTQFQIYFKENSPVTVASSVVQPPVVTTDRFHGAKVLVAEDEAQVLEIVTKTLVSLGCQVVPAHSGDAALQIFERSSDFDLLVTDVVMPGALMGPHLADAVREIRPDLPVIFMSGYADEAMIQGHGLRENDVRLSKPASRRSLIAAVKQVLA